MKKLLNVSLMLLALSLAFTGCASGGSAKEESGIPHPRSYTFDVIDGGSATINMPWNTYGPNYQATPFFTGLVKKDKPQAGDTVTFKMKATSNVDLPLLLAYPCSTAPSWVGLDSGDNDARVMAKDVKAGEPFECEISFVLTAKMGADFALCMQYDNPDQEVKTGAAATLTLERICESTDTTAEVPSAPHIANIDCDLGKYAAFLEIATNHPWINGVQDMSVISNYQATPEVTKAWGDDLPIAGDTVTVTWTATADNDISKVYIRPVDCSAAANWWKELIEPVWATEDGDTTEMDAQMLFGENIVAGEPFTLTKTFTFDYPATAQVNFCIWYEVDAADGPSICKIVK